MPTIPKPQAKPWEYNTRPEKPTTVFNYSLSRWTKASLRHRRVNPLCVECLKAGRPEPATCVDHIVPITTGADPWDETNWQSLCTRHHSQKTKRENGIYKKAIQSIPFDISAKQKAIEAQRVCLVIYGNMASGKSTFCKEIIKYLPDYKYVNLDEKRIEAMNVAGLTADQREENAKQMCSYDLLNISKTLYETTGATKYFNEIINTISQRSVILYVHIKCSKDVCVKRFYKRREAGQQDLIQFSRHSPEALIRMYDERYNGMRSHIQIESDNQTTDEMVKKVIAWWGGG